MVSAKSRQPKIIQYQWILSLLSPCLLHASLQQDLVFMVPDTITANSEVFRQSKLCLSRNFWSSSVYKNMVNVSVDKLGCISSWSPSLCFRMRKSDEMAIGKAHSTLQKAHCIENLRFFAILLWISENFNHFGYNKIKTGFQSSCFLRDFSWRMWCSSPAGENVWVEMIKQKLNIFNVTKIFRN